MPSKDFFSNKRLQLIVISILVFFMYVRTTGYEYTGLDDVTLIESNYPFIKNFNNIPKAFKQHVLHVDKTLDNEKDYYRPMLTLSLMLDAQIAGNSKPKWYHFANMLYHLTACLILFLLLHKLKVNNIAAFLLTLLFAVHPVVDQAVAWIPGRNDILLAIFMMLSFMYFLNYIESKNTKDLVWHSVFFGCALFTKENGIMLPILFLFYLKFISSPSPTLPKGKGVDAASPFLREGFRMGTGYAAFILLWLYLRGVAIAGSTTDNSPQAFVSNFINNAPFMLQYIGKAILPFNLSVMCMMEDTNYMYVIAAIVILALGIYFSKNKRWSFVLFGLLWFILFLAPSFSARLVEGLEHRLYLPLIGFIILAAETDWMKGIQNSELKIKNLAAPVGYILVLFFISNNRLSIFKNRFNFNISAMQTSQYAVVPCVNLAGDYQIAGNNQKAIEMYKVALTRDSIYGIVHPKNRTSYYSILHDNLGVIYLGRQQFAEAEQQFLLGSKSGDAYAIYHLASVYTKTNRTQQAVPLWKKVIALQPNQPDFKDTYLRLAQYAKTNGDTATYTYYIQAYKKMGF